MKKPDIKRKETVGNFWFTDRNFFVNNIYNSNSYYKIILLSLNIVIVLLLWNTINLSYLVENCLSINNIFINFLNSSDQQLMLLDKNNNSEFIKHHILTKNVNSYIVNNYITNEFMYNIFTSNDSQLNFLIENLKKTSNIYIYTINIIYDYLNYILLLLDNIYINYILSNTYIEYYKWFILNQTLIKTIDNNNMTVYYWNNISELLSIDKSQYLYLKKNINIDLSLFFKKKINIIRTINNDKLVLLEKNFKMIKIFNNFKVYTSKNSILYEFLKKQMWNKTIIPLNLDRILDVTLSKILIKKDTMSNYDKIEIYIKKPLKKEWLEYFKNLKWRVKMRYKKLYLNNQKKIILELLSKKFDLIKMNKKKFIKINIYKNNEKFIINKFDIYYKYLKKVYSYVYKHTPRRKYNYYKALFNEYWYNVGTVMITWWKKLDYYNAYKDIKYPKIMHGEIIHMKGSYSINIKKNIKELDNMINIKNIKENNLVDLAFEREIKRRRKKIIVKDLMEQCWKVEDDFAKNKTLNTVEERIYFKKKKNLVTKIINFNYFEYNSELWYKYNLNTKNFKYYPIYKKTIGHTRENILIINTLSVMEWWRMWSSYTKANMFWWHSACLDLENYKYDYMRGEYVIRLRKLFYLNKNINVTKDNLVLPLNYKIYFKSVFKWLKFKDQNFSYLFYRSWDNYTPIPLDHFVTNSVKNIKGVWDWNEMQVLLKVIIWKSHLDDVLKHTFIKNAIWFKWWTNEAIGPILPKYEKYNRDVKLYDHIINNVIEDTFIMNTLNIKYKKYTFIFDNIDRINISYRYKKNLLVDSYIKSFDNINIKEKIKIILNTKYLILKNKEIFQNQNIIFSKIKNDKKQIFFSSLYFDINSNKFKHSKEFLKNIINIDKNLYFRSLNQNIKHSMEYLNKEEYIKIYKNKILKTKKIFVTDKNKNELFTWKRIINWKDNFRFGKRHTRSKVIIDKKYSKLFFVKFQNTSWRWKLYSWRFSIYKQQDYLQINKKLIKLINLQNYLIKNINWYKDVCKNLIYYIINPKLKEYEIILDRKKYPINLIYNIKNIKMYGKPNDLKYFGGYTFWYDYFDSWKKKKNFILNEIIGKNITYKIYKKEFPFYARVKVHNKTIRILSRDWIYHVNDKVAKYASEKKQLKIDYNINIKELLIKKYTTTKQIYILNKNLRSALFSDDIWALNKFKIKYVKEKFSYSVYNIDWIYKLINTTKSKDQRLFEYLNVDNTLNEKIWGWTKKLNSRYNLIFSKWKYQKISNNYYITIIQSWKNFYKTKNNTIILYNNTVMDDIFDYEAEEFYFFNENRINLWIKNILIKRPIIDEFYRKYPKKRLWNDYIENILPKKKTNVYKVPNKYKIRLWNPIYHLVWNIIHGKYKQRGIPETSSNIWRLWYEKFNHYFLAKQPIIFRMFKEKELQWTENPRGWFDLNFKQILVIAQKAEYLFYNTKKLKTLNMEKLSYYWIKEYSKNIANINKLKYFIIEKLKVNKIEIEEKHIYVQDGNKKNIINFIIKNYKTKINKWNKDLFYISELKNKRLENIQEKEKNINYWREDYYKKKIFYKNFFYETYYNNIVTTKLTYFENYKFYEEETIWDVEKDQTIHFYYKIHFKSLNLNILKHISKFNKINLKKEYLILSSNLYKEEKLQYELYLIYINIKYNIITSILNIKKTIMFGIDIGTIIIIKYIYTKYTKRVVILILILVLYVSLVILILYLIKSNKPLNNIYAIKTLLKKKENKKESINIWNIKEMDLRNILDEDITFGTEQQYIYGLTNKKQPWVKIKIYNKYTKKIKEKIKENYKGILYKKFLYEQNINELENNVKLKIDVESYLDFWDFLKNYNEYIQFWKWARKFWNDRFYNYGRKVKIESKELHSEDLPHFITNTWIQSKILKVIIFYVRIIFGFIWILIVYSVKRFWLYWFRENYFKTFRGNEVTKKKTMVELSLEFKILLQKIKEQRKLKWYFYHMDFAFLETTFKKENIDINPEIILLELEEINELYINGLEYIIKHIKNIKIETEEDLLELMEIWENINKKVKIQEKYIEDIYKIYTKMTNEIDENEQEEEFLKIEKREWSTYSLELQNLKMELHYIDLITFKMLLNVIDNDMVLKEKLKKKIKIVDIIKNIKKIDWKKKNINLYKLKLENLIKGKDFKLIKSLMFYKKKIKSLFMVYRYFTTLGSRIYYLWSLIVTLSVIWWNSIYKFKTKNFNLSSTIKVFFIDIQKFIIKTYWEYILLDETLNLKIIEKIKKSSNIKLWKNILIYTIIIIMPTTLYILILISIYLIIYIIYSWKKKIEKKKNEIQIFIEIKHEKKIKNIKKLFNFLNFLKNSFVFIIIDLKTGYTIFTRVYIYIYQKISNFEWNLYITKKAYKKGKIEKNKIYGIYMVLKYIYLKLKVYLENILKIEKKEIEKISWKERINNLKKKKAIIWFISQQNKDIKELKLILSQIWEGLLYLITSKYFIKEIENSTFNYIYIMLKNYIQKKKYKYIIHKLVRKFYIIIIWEMIIERYLNIKEIYLNLNSKKEKRIFWLQIILIILFSPLIITINIYKWCRYKYYDVPWHEKKWRFKYSLSYLIDEYLRKHLISTDIWISLKKNRPWFFENFLRRKGEKLSYKRMYLIDYKLRWVYGYQGRKPLIVFWSKINWNKWYKYYVNWKDIKKNTWLKRFIKLEQVYKRVSRQKKHKIPIKRLYIVWKKYKKEKIRNKKMIIELKEVSRDKFLRRKSKDRKKIQRRYLWKGLINWISYRIFKKVIFTKIKELKKQKIYIKKVRNKRYKYYVANTNMAIHITARLKKVPPQLWFLVILYDYYYKNVMQFILAKRKAIYHKAKETPLTLKVKWRIHPYFGKFGLSELYRLLVIKTKPIVTGESLQKFSARKPDNLLLRYMLYVLEIINPEGWSEKKTWSDISAKFGLTYDSLNNKLKYEGKTELIEDDDKIERVIRYDQSSPLLFKHFEEEKRIKTAFIFKMACDGTALSALRLTQKITTKEEEERAAQMFDEFLVSFSPTFGYERYLLDLAEAWDIIWDYDKFLIHYVTVDNIETYTDTFRMFKTLNEVSKFFSVIFYDICLEEIKNNLLIYTNYKKKELLYIENIEIYIEPALNIPINYIQYPEINYAKEMGNMSLSIRLQGMFLARGLNRKKIINFVRVVDEEDTLKEPKWDYLDLITWNSFEQKDEVAAYEAIRMTLFFELDYKYDYDKAIMDILENIDIVYAWKSMIINKFNYLEEDTNIERVALTKEFAINKLVPNWGTKRTLQRKKKNLKDPILFINVVKLSLIQWLQMDIVEKERLKLYKLNTILFNERYNINYIELLPIRIQLPLKLEFSEELYRAHDNIHGDYEDSYMLLLRKFATDRWTAEFLTHPWVISKEFAIALTEWEKFKKHVKVSHKMSMQEIFLARIDPFHFKKEQALELFRENKEYDEIYKAFEMVSMRGWNITDMQTMIRVGFDWLLYWRIWYEVEEFTHDDWFLLRLQRYARDALEIRWLYDHYPWTAYWIYNPRYYMAHIMGYKIYKWLKYLGIISFLIGAYNIMYCPGEFFINPYYSWMPIWFSIYFFYLWWFIRKDIKIRDIAETKEKDLYLYKFQAEKNIELKNRFWPEYKTNFEKLEKLKVELDKGNPTLTEDLWKTNRSSYIKSKFNTFSWESVLPCAVISWWAMHVFYNFWRWRRYTGWHYVRRDPDKWQNKYGKWNNAYTRYWYKWDRYERVSEGKNMYNDWYVHFFRRKKGLKDWILDYGWHTDSEKKTKSLFFLEKQYIINISKINLSDFKFLSETRLKNLDFAEHLQYGEGIDPDIHAALWWKRKDWGNLLLNKMHSSELSINRKVGEHLVEEFYITKKNQNYKKYFNKIIDVGPKKTKWWHIENIIEKIQKIDINKIKNLRARDLNFTKPILKKIGLRKTRERITIKKYRANILKRYADNKTDETLERKNDFILLESQISGKDKWKDKVKFEKSKNTLWDDFWEWYKEGDLDNYNYDEFNFIAKRNTTNLINRDKINYYSHRDKWLYNQYLLKIKQEAYNQVKPLPFEYLIQISKHEKHINIMWYNLMKYKYYRHFSVYYKDFEKAKDHLSFVIHLPKEYILNVKMFYNNIDWGKFLWKLYKLQKYIINWNIENKKWQLIIEIFTTKITSGYDLYERIFRFIKIIGVYLPWEEILSIYTWMIKIFF